ncbi:hypothetical protein FRC0043_00303 [Corynebacterium belfantii]|nr:hypothetical protein FRC0043_00303 [Corynebacterium belfantii]
MPRNKTRGTSVSSFFVGCFIHQVLAILSRKLIRALHARGLFAIPANSDNFAELVRQCDHSIFMVNVIAVPVVLKLDAQILQSFHKLPTW